MCLYILSKKRKKKLTDFYLFFFVMSWILRSQTYDIYQYIAVEFSLNMCPTCAYFSLVCCIYMVLHVLQMCAGVQ